MIKDISPSEYSNAKGNVNRICKHNNLKHTNSGIALS